MSRINPILNIQKIDDKVQISQESPSISSVPPSFNNNMPLNSFNAYLVNFKGLNKVLSRKAYENANEIKNEMIKYSNSNGIVGNLPAEWISRIPKNERATIVKELYADFKRLIKQFRRDENDRMFAYGLNNALHKAGLIGEQEKLTIKYLDNGNHGSGYHIKGVFGEEFMIKIFHLSNQINHYHGNYTELNRAAYWKKNAGSKTQMVKFYFGDVDAGYMINKYIGDKTPEYRQKTISEEIYGLKAYDSDTSPGQNNIKGYQTDYGGFIINNPVLSQNKTARYVYKKLYNLHLEERLYMATKLLTSSKFKNNKDIKLGLASSINLFPASERAEQFNRLLQNADDNLKSVLDANRTYLE